MERKEPTLYGGVANDRDEAPIRRTTGFEEARPAPNVAERSPSSSSPLPAIALVIALIGVGGAAFLGWQLMEAQAMLVKDSARIAQLESQLNVTSTESTQSVTALGINLQKIDAEVKKLWDASKKSNSDRTDKETSLSRAIEGTKTEIASIKGDTNSLKQDSLSHKASLEDHASRIDTADKNLAELRKKVADVAASVNVILTQVKSAEGLSARITKTEEAIDAIDDNRRIINKDLLQIKQQLNIKSQ